LENLLFASGFNGYTSICTTDYAIVVVACLIKQQGQNAAAERCKPRTLNRRIAMMIELQ